MQELQSLSCFFVRGLIIAWFAVCSKNAVLKLGLMFGISKYLCRFFCWQLLCRGIKLSIIVASMFSAL